MNAKRFDLAANAVAAALLIVAGYKLWGGAAGAPRAHAREVRVAWECDPGERDVCRAMSQVERCTTCHEPKAHPHGGVLVARHQAIGCVACHGGDGLASERSAAHRGLAALGKDGAVPEVQARCAACHTETSAAACSPAKDAWAQWIALREDKPAPPAGPPPDTTDYAPSLTHGRTLFRSLRCGACHASRDPSPIATPLGVLGLRGNAVELAAGLREHGTRAHVDLGLDETTSVAVATHLEAIASADESTAMVHRASVPGSSAEEGKTLYERLACKTCHDDLAWVATSRTADWVAYYLSDPARANPAATMPSLRLTAREAASLAAHLVKPAIPEARLGSRTEEVGCKLPSGETKTMARDACGEAVVSAEKCAACHTNEVAPTGPALGDGKVQDHAGFHFDAPTRRDLATYVLAQRAPRARPDLRVAPREGEESYEARECAGCHEKGPGPSLFGEGLRTRPQWLFAFLGAPQRHPVRPSFHPELAYKDLVAPDHVQPRMPSYALGERETTALVRFFSERDGATFPYAASLHVTLSGDALTGALAELERKDGGACTTCHTVAPPDVARAREQPDLAPPLALAHERLRAAWVEACIAQPEVWVHGMPALARPYEEIDRLRDLVLLLRDRTVLPPPGQESSVPALGLDDLQP